MMKAWVKFLLGGVALVVLTVVVVIGLQKFACIGECNRFVYGKDDLLDGDLKTASNAANIDSQYTSFLRAIYTLNQAAHNVETFKKYAISSADDFIKYSKSGRPISGLYIPFVNARNEAVVMDNKQAYMWTKLVQQNEDIYLDRVAIRVLHKDKVNQVYTPEEIQQKTIFMDMPTMAIFDLMSRNGRKIIQITFVPVSDVETNYAFNRFAIDVAHDFEKQPINTRENNLKSANQSLSALILLMSKNSILDYYDQKLFGMWVTKANVSKNDLPNLFMSLANQDEIFKYAK